MPVLSIIALCCHHTNCLVRNSDLRIFIVKDISSLCKEVIDSLGVQFLRRYFSISVSQCSHFITHLVMTQFLEQSGVAEFVESKC